MEIRQLEYFLRVATEGSFSRAADSLHMTQPPLSVSIAKLEAELGRPLLARESRGVRLTEAGSHFAERAERVLADLYQLREDMQNDRFGAAGRLSIASVPTITWFLLPRLLHRFVETSPLTDITVADPPPATVIEMVQTAEVDVGLIATVSCEQLQESYRSSLHVLNVGELRMLVALPPSFADSPERVSLADLHGQTWIMPRRSLRIRGLPELFDSLWEKLGLTPPLTRRVATLQTAIPLVASGLGVSLVPESVRSMGNTPVVLRELVDDMPPLQAAAIWSSERPASRALGLLLDILRAGGMVILL